LARLPSNITLEIEEVSQTIDQSWLKGITDEETLEAIGQATIDYIRERASKGLGLGGETMKPTKYSQSYQNSPDFKAAGKSASPVNMRLSGDMLNSIDLILEGDRLRIGLPPDESPKAHGHMTGQEGQGTLPKRQFFGVTKKEFDQILRTVARPQRTRSRSSRVANQNEIDEILGTLDTLGDLFRLVE
jgi:hypothetical protein